MRLGGFLTLVTRLPATVQGSLVSDTKPGLQPRLFRAGHLDSQMTPEYWQLLFYRVKRNSRNEQNTVIRC